MSSPRWARRFSRLVCAAALSSAVTARAQPASPADPDVELAKSHFKTGELNFAAGKYADAAREFEEAYHLTAHAELLYNMGKCYDASGDLVAALAAYRKFLDAVQGSPARASVEKRAAELDRAVPRVEITSSVAGSSVTLDGQQIGTTPLSPGVIEVNPGAHTIEIAADGFATSREKLTLATAQTRRVDATLVSLVRIVPVERHEHVPVHERWYLWTPIGLVVVAGVVTGAVLGVRAAEHIDGPHGALPPVVPVGANP